MSNHLAMAEERIRQLQAIIVQRDAEIQGLLRLLEPSAQTKAECDCPSLHGGRCMYPDCSQAASTGEADRIEALERELAAESATLQEEFRENHRRADKIVALRARVTELETALWHFVDRFIEDNDDPNYKDPFWFMKDEPFYPILQERLRSLTAETIVESGGATDVEAASAERSPLGKTVHAKGCEAVTSLWEPKYLLSLVANATVEPK